MRPDDGVQVTLVGSEIGGDQAQKNWQIRLLLCVCNLDSFSQGNIFGRRVELLGHCAPPSCQSNGSESKSKAMIVCSLVYVVCRECFIFTNATRQCETRRQVLVFG